MQRKNGYDIPADKPITIKEASVASGISVRKINWLINEEVLPKSVCVKIGNRRALRAFAVPMLGFAASDGLKLDKGARLQIMRKFGKFAKKNWTRLQDDPNSASNLHIATGCLIAAPGKSASEGMAGLNRLIYARSRVVEDPDIRGGIPTIRGTRVGVREAAGSLAGDGIDMALEDYPSLSREDFEAWALYTRAYPKPRRKRRTKTDGPSDYVRYLTSLAMECKLREMNATDRS